MTDPTHSSGNRIHICAVTITADQPLNHRSSVNLIIDRKRMAKRDCGKKLSKLRWDLEPFLPLHHTNHLTIQLKVNHRVRESKTIAEASASFEQLQLMLVNGKDIYQDHQLGGSPKIAIDFTSVNPIAKTVFESINAVYKLLEGQEQLDKLIVDLVQNMAYTLDYIRDVQQFVRIVQLKKVIDDVTPLLEETTLFVVKYGASSAAGHALRSLISSSDRGKVDALNAKFAQVKQQFDRGLAVQAGGLL